MTPPPFAFALSTSQILVLLVIGILLFGKRLPEVGRSLGKGLMEFKKGMAGIEDEVAGSLVRDHQSPPTPASPGPPQRVAATAPKYVETDPSTSPMA